LSISDALLRGIFPNLEVYLTFSPRFERIWLESKKRLLDYMDQKPAHLGLRSQYAAAVQLGEKSTSRSARKAFRRSSFEKGLESVKDADGNVIQEAPLSVFANFRQRALDVAIRT